MKNLNLTGGLVFSQRVLLQLPQRGISREDAYKIVQRNAMKVWADLQEGKKAIDEQGHSLFLQNLLADEDLTQEALAKTRSKSALTTTTTLKM